ncbi:hypothetical protein D3C85_1353980 [compost metagenome]
MASSASVSLCGSFMASACRCAASCSTSGWAGARAWANSPSSAGSLFRACCNAASGASPISTRPSSTRLRKCSAAQASSARTCARTMRPLPLRVCRPRRSSIRASRSAPSACQRAHISSSNGNSSLASSRNISRNSSSIGVSSGATTAGTTSAAGSGSRR